VLELGFPALGSLVLGTFFHFFLEFLKVFTFFGIPENFDFFNFFNFFDAFFNFLIRDNFINFYKFLCHVHFFCFKNTKKTFDRRDFFQGIGNSNVSHILTKVRVRV